MRRHDPLPVVQPGDSRPRPARPGGRLRDSLESRCPQAAVRDAPEPVAQRRRERLGLPARAARLAGHGVPLLRVRGRGAGRAGHDGAGDRRRTPAHRAFRLARHGPLHVAIRRHDHDRRGRDGAGPDQHDGRLPGPGAGRLRARRGARPARARAAGPGGPPRARRLRARPARHPADGRGLPRVPARGRVETGPRLGRDLFGLRHRACVPLFCARTSRRGPSTRSRCIRPWPPT